MTAFAVDRRQAAVPARRPAPMGPAGRMERGVRPCAPPLPGASSGAGLVSARACAVTRPTARPRVSVGETPIVVTRLTDRGLAVVLALIALVVVASLGCVGATAARVMAEPTLAATLR